MNIEVELTQVFDELLHTYKFIDLNIESEQDSFIAKFRNDEIIIKIQTYNREIYCYVASTEVPNEEAAVINIINYQNRESRISEKENWSYFHNIIDFDKAYHLQLVQINEFLIKNMGTILEFYEKGKVLEKMQELRNYMIIKYPETFKTIN
jgi:hypothetical protein